jgi:hypothetical protein
MGRAATPYPATSVLKVIGGGEPVLQLLLGGEAIDVKVLLSAPNIMNDGVDSPGATGQPPNRI